MIKYIGLIGLLFHISLFADMDFDEVQSGKYPGLRLERGLDIVKDILKRVEQDSVELPVVSLEIYIFNYPADTESGYKHLRIMVDRFNFLVTDVTYCDNIYRCEEVVE